MITKISYPRRHVVKQGGFKVVVTCRGLFATTAEGNNLPTHHRGDVSVWLPGRLWPAAYVVDSYAHPFNLNHADDVIEKLQVHLLRRNLMMDDGLKQLVRKALEPYRQT